MPLANDSYKIKISSTAGLIQIMSTPKVGSLVAAVSGTLSSNSKQFVINATTSAYNGVPPKMLFTLSGFPVMELQTTTTPEMAVSGVIASKGAGGFWIGDNIGIDNAPSAGQIPIYTVSGGIVIANSGITIDSITSGLSAIASATSNYWTRTGNTLTTLSAGDHLKLDGDFVIRQGGSATSLKYNNSSNKTTFYGIGTVPIVDIDPDGSFEKLSVTGSIYCRGDLNVDGSKNFKIPHPNPIKKDYWLYHSTLEGPEMGVYFRNQFSMTGNSYLVSLPDYWQYLVEEKSVQVICDSREYLEKEVSLTSIRFNRTTHNYYEIPVSFLIIAQRKSNNENTDFQVERMD